MKAPYTVLIVGWLWTTMSLPLRMDLRAQAETLAFLVVSHLAIKYATGKWMNSAQTVDPSLFYSKSNQRDEDAICKAQLASRSLSIARVVEEETHIVLNGSAMATLFDSRLRLDFSSPTTREIYGRCLNYLLRVRWYR